MAARDSGDQIVISSLIELLQGIQQRHGDLPVVLRDADTCWTFRMSAEHIAIGLSRVNGTPTPRLEIGADYSSEYDTPTRLSDLSLPHLIPQ